MKTGNVKISIDEYNDLKKYKDNFNRAFVKRTKDSDYDYAFDYEFYSEEEINKKLIDKINELENNSCKLKDEYKNLKHKFQCEYKELFYELKSFSILQFIKYKIKNK
jgi:hypothetical protein